MDTKDGQNEYIAYLELELDNAYKKIRVMKENESKSKIIDLMEYISYLESEINSLRGVTERLSEQLLSQRYIEPVE
jgi:hypothetical protein